MKKCWSSTLTSTLRAFAFITFFILAINVSVFIWAWKRLGISGGHGSLYRGDCSTTKKIDLLLHLLINVFSTLVLVSSNAFMQVYSSPTRQEIDAAHRQRRWLHIGILSLRNLRSIAKRKKFICLLLALSSVPFHLLYNALVFTSLSANEYRVGVVTEEFLSGVPWNLSSYYGIDAWQNIQQSASAYKRLSNSDCIKAYSDAFQASKRNVILVSSDKNNTNSILWHRGAEEGDLGFDRWHFWICSVREDDGPSIACNPNTILANPTNWKVLIILSSTVSLKKRKHMLYILLFLNVDNILTSVGDAILSFVTSEDSTTSGICLANKRHLYTYWDQPGHPGQYDPQPGRWHHAASKKRWLSFTVLMFICFFLVFLLQYWGLKTLETKKINPYTIGFGALNVNAMVFADNVGNTALMSILANTPQLILSIMYLLYNSLLRSMFFASDFAKYAFKGRHLMVASPSNGRRGLWLLGVPWLFGLSSLILQTLLHWFVSQSIFAVQVDVYTPDGSPDTSYGGQSSQFSNCGYSPVAIWASLAGGIVLTVSAYGFGLRHFQDGSPPIVSTCSAAISAVCHPGNLWDNESMVYKKVRWAAVGNVGHCSIVPAQVWKAGLAGSVVGGRSYAGTLDYDMGMRLRTSLRTYDHSGLS